MFPGQALPKMAQSMLERFLFNQVARGCMADKASDALRL